MEKIRLPIQVIALFLQTYFFIETIRLYVCGYVMYMGNPIENAWYSMLFTLLVVVVCEFFSLRDAILFFASKKNRYSKIYLALIILNACLFMSLAYYSTIGTVVCLSFYSVLFVIRVINLILNFVDVLKKT